MPKIWKKMRSMLHARENARATLHPNKEIFILKKTQLWTSFKGPHSTDRHCVPWNNFHIWKSRQSWNPSNQIATISNADFHNKNKRSKSLSVEGGTLNALRSSASNGRENYDGTIGWFVAVLVAEGKLQGNSDIVNFKIVSQMEDVTVTLSSMDRYVGKIEVKG